MTQNTLKQKQSKCIFFACNFISIAIVVACLDRGIDQPKLLNI